MPNRNSIDLDCLLYGSPTWDQVVDFFENGDWHDERYEVEAIEKHLLTEAQRQLMFTNKLTIEKMLNGRHTCENVVNSIFNEWNKKLGHKAFGYY